MTLHDKRCLEVYDVEQINCCDAKIDQDVRYKVVLRGASPLLIDIHPHYLLLYYPEVCREKKNK